MKTEEQSTTLYSAVAQTAYRLHRNLTSDNPQQVSNARATLSQLRQAVGREPGSHPTAWSIVADSTLDVLPESELGRGALVKFLRQFLDYFSGYAAKSSWPQVL